MPLGRRRRPWRLPTDTTKKIVSRAPGVMGGELVFAGTRAEVKTLIDYLKAGHSLDDFPTVSREQAEAYLEITLRAADAATTAGTR